MVLITFKDVYGDELEGYLLLVENRSYAAGAGSEISTIEFENHAVCMELFGLGCEELGVMAVTTNSVAF